ncbi:MAG: hypothetical protein J0I41_19750 [Filimonas sp.]|nr:hypothetical protein [Filimonas sp.]
MFTLFQVPQFTRHKGVKSYCVHPSNSYLTAWNPSFLCTLRFSITNTLKDFQMTPDFCKTLLEEIIDNAYKLLTHKLAYGGLVARNENAFQLELGHILKTLGQLYEFSIEDKFHLEFETYIPLNSNSLKSKSDRARVDLLLQYRHKNVTTKAAIELKFFKKENAREPNNRYDVFRDLAQLELYRRHNIDLCYFILSTDHAHYAEKEDYSPDTADFDFRHNSIYAAGTPLRYKTLKPFGPDIKLSNNYHFKWDKIRDLFFLKVKV